MLTTLLGGGVERSHQVRPCLSRAGSEQTISRLTVVFGRVRVKTREGNV